jgi:hypothetical protein
MRFDHKTGASSSEGTLRWHAGPGDLAPHQAIRPWLWVLLSDNESVLRRWAREFHDELIGAIANGQ